MIRGAVPVTPGEQYTLTLSTPGRASAASGPSNGDTNEIMRHADSQAEAASFAGVGPLGPFSCVLPVTEGKSEGSVVAFSGSFDCTGIAMQLQFQVTLEGEDVPLIRGKTPFACGPVQLLPPQIPPRVPRIPPGNGDPICGPAMAGADGGAALVDPTAYFVHSKVEVVFATVPFAFEATEGCSEIDLQTPNPRIHCDSNADIVVV